MMLLRALGVTLILNFTHTALAAPPAPSAPPTLTSEQEQYVAAAKMLWESLDRRQGDVSLPGGVATLHVPDTFYYLSPTDAEKVLVDVWGNPPGAGKSTLGMLLPSQYTPFDDASWGVTISYNEDGYVSDEDAKDIDYGELLTGMQEAAEETSKERVRMGYEPVKLIGWAEAPRYDEQTHKLHWAKEFQVGDNAIHTLNYNIRVLGRKGVLVLNFIAGMDQKPEIDSNVDTVLGIAEFNDGMRYTDFNPNVDKVAAYGIGALVAGKVAAKTGLLAAALVFLKKFGVLIVVGVGALLGRLLKRKKTA